MKIEYSWIALFLGFCLDLLFGDPYWMPHCIRLIGKWIRFLEKRLCSFFGKTPIQKRTAGVFLVIFTILPTVLLPIGILTVLYQLSLTIGILVEAFFCYQLLAAKCLKKESMKVYYSLNQENLEDARKNVSMIVGRDTDCLDKEGIIKATIETVAENTSDGVIAPLFYMAFAGAIGGFFYKAINTMDSMVGYKNEKYLYLGRAAAKLDDIVNFIPARISAFLMILSACLLKLDGKNAYLIWKRDRRKHNSPNSAQTEAVCAGALKIQLAGDAKYFGKLYRKPYIGDKINHVSKEDIKRVNALLYVTAFLMIGIIYFIIFLTIKTKKL